MAYIMWFQRKPVWITVTMGMVILLLYQFYGKKDLDHSHLTLHEIQSDIVLLQHKLKLCRKEISSNYVDVTIFIITPTYARYTQQADLVRMSNTLKHIENIHWILVEDSEVKTNLVTLLLNDSGIVYTHLNKRTQKDLVLGKNDPRWKKHRGLDQRNLAIKWLRENMNSYSEGVVYFADDDNTYHLDLFTQIRTTSKISMWPVALVGGLKWEGPVCKAGRVIRFHTAWQPQRTFPVDMAAFSINLKVLLEHPGVFFDPDSQRGWIETDFLSKLELAKEDIEAKASDCMKILVWHTQTAEPKMKDEMKLVKKGGGSNPQILV